MIEKLYLDLDGVFADFNKRVEQLSGQPIHELTRKSLWKAVNTDKQFFLNLELFPHSIELWNFVKRYDPIFLTGAPASHSFAEQKRKWVSNHFGADRITLVVPKHDKKNYAGVNRVLIDDNPSLIDEWKANNGIGILFCSVEQVIRELKTQD